MFLESVHIPTKKSKVNFIKLGRNLLFFYLKGNVGIFMHPKYFRFITKGKLVDIVSVNLNSLASGCIVDACNIVLV